MIKDLEIEEKVYAVVCPDIYPSTSINKCLDSNISFNIYDNISKCIITPCLDQIIETALDYLFLNLENKFTALKKVFKAYNMSK